MGDLNDNVPVGGGRAPLDAMTLSDAEAAMHKGRGGMIVAAVAVLVALAGGFIFLVGGDDDRRVYSELGKAINGVRVAEFDQFWACLLQGENLADIKSNEDLEAKIELRAAKAPARFAKQLRDDCLPKLQAIEPKLSTLILPPDLKPSVGSVVTAVGDLRSACSNFVSYLDQPELVYDDEESRQKIKKIGRGWYDFRKAHAEANTVLKGHLEK